MLNSLGEKIGWKIQKEAKKNTCLATQKWRKGNEWRTETFFLGPLKSLCKDGSANFHSLNIWVSMAPNTFELDFFFFMFRRIHCFRILFGRTHCIMFWTTLFSFKQGLGPIVLWDSFEWCAKENWIFLLCLVSLNVLCIDFFSLLHRDIT